MLNLREYINHKTFAVYDYQFLLHLKAAPLSEWLETSPPFDCQDEYLEKFHQLIINSKLNALKGLERFSKRHLINGTTQSFDECYLRNKGKRLRIFRGEYAYHKRVNPNFTYIEDAPLEKEDHIIISLPFCSSGDIHPLMDQIIREAEKQNISVEIDCAYFGTCHSLSYDLSSSSIKAVSFSLSKGMGLGDIRSGIRYSDYDDGLPIAQQNNFHHTVKFAAKIGLHMMERFDFDYIPNTYRVHQESFCKDLGLSPTKCMHLALGDSQNYSEYLIDDKYYRVGIREGVKKRKQGRI
ncbi:MAG: HipA domain-containing protein [Bacteriovoracaceae bacterium]|nr:HipA domain-containing protein [Bacteriovoracaceae bacterium]